MEKTFMRHLASGGGQEGRSFQMNSSNLSGDKFKNTLNNFMSYKVFFIICLVIIALQTYARYHGLNNGYYLDHFQYIFHESAYTNDIYFQNSFFRDSSILYDLAVMLHLHLDNDNVGYAIHVCFSMISVVVIYLFLKEFVIPSNPMLCLVLILLLIFFDNNRLIFDAKGGALFLLIRWHPPISRTNFLLFFSTV